jgi:tripartite-type tricarboxylate transporter receptor subunit TctC
VKRLLSRRTALAAATILPVANLLPRTAEADGPWKPSQGIRIVVPAAPGGTTDIVARLLAAFLQQAWGQSCVVDNKSGAGGVIGSNEVVKAAPDGYTALPYGPQSLAPVSGVVTAPNVLLVHPSVPAKTVLEFVAWLRAQSGKVSYASSSTGQSPHLSADWFLQLTGTKAEHIPYRGAAPAQDLTAGVTQFFFDNLTTGIEFVRAGKLRALGITSAQRNPLTPELVPICETMPELKPFDVSTWFGVFLPATTPKPVIAAFNDQMKSWLDDPRTKERFTQMAGFPAYGTPAEFDTFVKGQIALWKGVIDKERLPLDVN